MIAKLFFWFSVVFIFYAYLGYPILLIILCKFRRRPVKKGDIFPTVSFIITVHNEEKHIRQKIENVLDQDYPSHKLEIIIASDCSSDSTDDIVKSYESSGVRLIRAQKRSGKEGTQKLAIDSASGDILVFSDVSTRLCSDGITNIVKNFYDPTVGCVSSVDKYVDADNKVSGEGFYVRYEMFVRRLESSVNTLVGLSGSFFAARKTVCQNWALDLQSDFNTLLNSIKMGMRGISDPKSIGYYKNVIDEKHEFERKVRTILRGMTVLMENCRILNPIKYGFFAWQLFSHKLCRWLVPFALILAFFSNAILITNSGAYFVLFIFQIFFYGIALAGICTLRPINTISKIPFFLALVNLSIINAWYRYARGEKMVSWKPSER